ncbi:GTPase activating protein BUD2 [Spathaspora sp. JA1]|nr:GTPase activating protein BUD2 [Spathaspora sp. JA1]
MNKYPSPFHKIISRSKETFTGRDFLVSTDSVSWNHVHTLKITTKGQLYSYAEDDSDQCLLLQSLQACYIQIYPTLTTSSNVPSSPSPDTTMKKAFTRKPTDSLHTVNSNTEEGQLPVIFIKTYDNDKVYIKIPSQSNFGCLLSSLVVWQNLRPSGLSKKWYCENKQRRNLPSSELLVCRFKIYGPIPPKHHKNLNIVPGYPAPVYQSKIDDELSGSGTNGSVNGGGSITSDMNEGWFYTMGALNSNGVLNFISELDGTLLYSLDIKSIMSSEIREVHNSIFNSSNVLFIGQLKELRYNNILKTISNLNADQYVQQPFLTREGKSVPNNQRILIEFPLHIDLEDWFVGLNYFCKREYIGTFNDKSKYLGTDISKLSKQTKAEPPKLSGFTKTSFRVSKKISIDIIEAKFDTLSNPQPGSKIYAETRMWGYPWSRTASVAYTANPFWKEEFSTDLPISTQMIHILIKKCNGRTPSSKDKLIGTVYVTPDILKSESNTSSTIMNIAGEGDSNGTFSKRDIVRLTIHDTNNIPIGKLVVDVNLREFHILSPDHFKPLEKMLINPTPMKDLIEFCNKNVPRSEFENVSLILLDIFQSLGVEDLWFKNLIEYELVHVDITTRKNYHKRNSSQQQQQQNHKRGLSASNNVFNTLFRGNSIFSKSLEKYNLRIGQEYLEKVFGDFFAKISKQNKNCEVDPRYVRLQERAKRKGKDINQELSTEEEDDDDDDDDDDEYELDEKYIEDVVNQNYHNLLKYVEEIWNKIYITSNDIPTQIKLQLKNFRTKVELACDPDDHTTSLNCISAFIFLRFFCPAILNPKLFYLTKNHQTGSTQRTLTLIAKILLNLANRQEFTPHKEPHLVRMNAFIKDHTGEIYDYFDKITDRKNDFNEKILQLSHEVKRFDLGLDDSTSSELPTTPYLIDKYLRLSEIIEILDFSKYSPLGSSSPITNGHIESFKDIRLDHDRNVYQIGSLEFEKADFLDLAGNNETEGFIKSLCQNNEEIFSFINSNITLQDIQKQSTKLVGKIHELETYLDQPEFPCNIYSVDPILWDSFTYEILNNRVFIDTTRNCIVSVDVPHQTLPSGYKLLAETNALASLKLRFITISSSFRQSMVDSDSVSRISLSFSSHSLGVVRGGNSKNIFKRWLRRN